MNQQKIKVKPGQIWVNLSERDKKFKITKVEENKAYVISKKYGTEYIFGYLNEDGSPSGWDIFFLESIEEYEPAVNDYVCPTCANDRCSKSEIKCWKCGNLL